MLLLTTTSDPVIPVLSNSSVNPSSTVLAVCAIRVAAGSRAADQVRVMAMIELCVVVVCYKDNYHRVTNHTQK